jgi:hypothetical protein
MPTIEQINDIQKTTLNQLGKFKWTDITSDLQEHIVMPKMMKKEKVKFDDGKAIQWNFQHTAEGNVRNVGLFASDQSNVVDSMVTASIPWTHKTANWSIDRREVAVNRGASRIVELVKTRRTGMMIDVAANMEAEFWDAPDANDTLKPFGVKYYVVRSASADGFNGGEPSGFTSGVANLLTATYPRWKNYTGRYVDVTKGDLVARVRKALRYTDFKPPVDIEQYNRGAARYSMYTNYDVVSALESLAENQNDNLGNDLASKDGTVMIRKVPVVDVPYLDADSTDPVYGIDWSVFYPVFLSGEYMRESEPQSYGSHWVSTVHLDFSYNFMCTNRRKLFIIDKA